MASCWLSSMAASPIGKIKLNTNSVNEMFGFTRDQTIKFDSEFLGNYFSIIKARFHGSPKPLLMTLSFGKPTVTFIQD